MTLACTACGRPIPSDAPSLGIQEDEHGGILGELVNCPDRDCGSTVVRRIAPELPEGFEVADPIRHARQLERFAAYAGRPTGRWCWSCERITRGELHPIALMTRESASEPWRHIHVCSRCRGRYPQIRKPSASDRTIPLFQERAQ